jgi:hypothetical protein
MDAPCKHESLPNYWHCRISGRTRHSREYLRRAGVLTRFLAHVPGDGSSAKPRSERRCASAMPAVPRSSCAARARVPRECWRLSGMGPAPRGSAVTTSTEWHLLTGELVRIRSHHEELAAASTIVPALSTLVPFAVALWMRIKRTRVDSKPPRKGDV